MLGKLAKSIKANPYLSASIFFAIISLIAITVFVFNSELVASTYRSGQWTKAYTENVTLTYGPVSFLACQSGLLYAYILGVSPTIALSLGFYLWHLNRKISKLEKALSSFADYNQTGEKGINK